MRSTAIESVKLESRPTTKSEAPKREASPPNAVVRASLWSSSASPGRSESKGLSCPDENTSVRISSTLSSLLEELEAIWVGGLALAICQSTVSNTVRHARLSTASGPKEIGIAGVPQASPLRIQSR